MLRPFNVKPYFLNIEMMKSTGDGGNPELGDQLLTALRSDAGGDPSMGVGPVQVSVLGAHDTTFFCSPELFFHAALSVGGNPIFEPPPFACPCTDGLLIIYTLKRYTREGSVDIHGGYILMTREEIESLDTPTSLCSSWKKASKPSNMATMLREMGFGEDHVTYLN